MNNPIAWIVNIFFEDGVKTCEVECPHCLDTHFHGGDSGFRVPHCNLSADDYEIRYRDENVSNNS